MSAHNWLQLFCGGVNFGSMVKQDWGGEHALHVWGFCGVTRLQTQACWLLPGRLIFVLALVFFHEDMRGVFVKGFLILRRTLCGEILRKSRAGYI